MVCRFTIFILFLSSLFVPSELNANQKLKVLHLSFHLGCIKDFEHVAKAEAFDLTSWYVLETKESRERFDPKPNQGSAVYNIGHERAARVWQANKDYFNSFDVVVTSDTAPLSRIFLQNGWNKGLVIWICNRFDYYDGASLDCNFPDAEYYDLFRKATQQKNVKVIGYVAFEHLYASWKNVNTGWRTIRPCGSVEDVLRHTVKSLVPESIKKEEAFHIPPRLEPHQVKHLVNKCKSLGIKTHCGPYSGPADLKDFKGIIAFPYAWSNLALFENIQLGLPYFVPSQKFLRELHANQAESHLYRFFALEHLEYSEWYNADLKGIITYFDSWKDLKQKVTKMNYDAMRKKIKAFGVVHKYKVMQQWHDVFGELQTYLVENKLF